MKKTFAVRLEEDQLENLRKIAEKEDRSVAAVVRRMINKGIEQKNELKVHGEKNG